EAWEILSAEEAATGLRATDPMPQRTQLHPVVTPATSSPDAAPEAAPDFPAESAATKPAAVNHYRVTWPQDDDAAVARDAPPGAGVDAADLPPIEALPAAESDPVDTVPATPQTGSAPRPDWLSHAEEQGHAEEKGHAEAQGEQQSEVPRPRASAAEATYTESQRTAEQIRSSKAGLFRRRRRQR